MALGDTMKALADPVRRQILERLRPQKMSAGEISQAFNLTQATVSYHLKILKKAGLVTTTKEKNFIYYDLNVSVFEEMLTWLAKLGIGGNQND